jgi:iron complex transport system substrate-binding protein
MWWTQHFLPLAAAILMAQQTAIAQPANPPAKADTSRIVSAGGAITEVLYALGVADRIVAVDATSQFPPEALKTKSNIGYFRALSTEGVLSVNPSVIIASDKAGPPAVVKALKASAVPYFEVDDRSDPSALAERVRAIAKLVDRESRGDVIVRDIEEGFSRLEAKRAAVKRPARVLFILSVQNGRVIAGGRNTSADAVFRLAGAVNCAEAVEGFKPVTDEALIEMNPEAIVVMSQPNTASLSDELLRLPGMRATAAGQTRRIIEMDGLYLLGFGPRAPDAARHLMDRLAEPAKAQKQSAAQ